MAEVEASHIPSLSEQYFLKENEAKSEIVAKSSEETGDRSSVTAVAEDVPKTEETPVSVDSEVSPAVAEETGKDSAEESKETAPADEATGDASEESNVTAEPEDADEQESEETPEIKLETAPADFRFPTTNQTRHCFTRYIEYHRCIAAKGEDAPECNKFAKYYRSLCPGEWIERWNEQRENGTFPGPL